VRHAAPVVFPVDFDGGEHLYRVHPINIQLVTDSVIMPAKEEHGYHSGTSYIVMLKDVIKVSLLQKGQNDRIKNIISVFLCTAGVGNVLWTNVCTSPIVLEAEVLWSGLQFVLILKLLKEH
jgi:hypothetical protein